jgi:hypothetical protein
MLLLFHFVHLLFSFFFSSTTLHHFDVGSWLEKEQKKKEIHFLLFHFVSLVCLHFFILSFYGNEKGGDSQQLSK